MRWNKFFVFVFGVFMISFALAVILSSEGGTSFASVNESSVAVYNFSVNNTATVSTANVSNVNVTLPSGFVFVVDSNTTDATGTFSNTSSVLSWDGDGLVMNGTLQNFWFNVTSSATPGDYNFTVVASNASGVYETQNISVTVNDTVAPVVTVNSPTNTTYTVASVILNVTLNEEGTCIYSFDAGTTNVSMVTADNLTFTKSLSLSNAAHVVNYYCNDTTGNLNVSENVSFTIAVIISNAGGGPFDSVNENTVAVYNFSVNNTQAIENVSGVNVTLPSGFVFVSGSNATDVAVSNFTNTSTVLTWLNTSLVLNGSVQYFWFNATSSVTPGDYNFTIVASNSTGVYAIQNISVTVNDTSVPVVSGGGGGGGGSSVSSLSASDLGGGYAITLRRGQGIRFTVSGDSHVFKVSSVNKDSISAVILSEAIRLEIMENSEELVDIDFDGFYDLNITLGEIGINSGSFIFTSVIKGVGSVVPENVTGEGNGEIVGEDGEVADGGIVGAIKDRGDLEIWIIVAVIVVFILLIFKFGFFKKKPKKAPRKVSKKEFEEEGV